MRKLIASFILILFFFSFSNAQIKLSEIEISKTYIISTNDGGEFVGKILTHDSREILLSTEKLGEITIPTYQIKEVRIPGATEISASGEILADNIFATRYFITTNGFDVKKGDSYILINWYGPDIQYGIADNWTIGVMSTWLGSPIIGTLKYSKSINENVSIGAGTLLGTLGYMGIDQGGILPYGALTYGDKKNNFTFSAGYGAVWYDKYNYDTRRSENTVDGEALMSFAGMSRITNSISFVFDSFIILGIEENIPFSALLIPGIRFQRKEGFAFQFGLTGLYSDFGNGGEFVPAAIPMVQLFWKF